MADLGKLQTIEEGVVMELRDPVSGAVLLDGVGPVTITLLGKDSDAYRQVQRAANNRRLRDASRGRRRDMTDEQLEAETLDLLVACTTGWSGVGLGDEDPLPFSAANARRLYSEPRLAWLREQVDGFIGDRANFFSDLKPS